MRFAAEAWPTHTQSASADSAKTNPTLETNQFQHKCKSLGGTDTLTLSARARGNAAESRFQIDEMSEFSDQQIISDLLVHFHLVYMQDFP